MSRTETDCKSWDGITVGLIDAMLTICQVLGPRLENFTSRSAPESVREALIDLANDSNFKLIAVQSLGMTYPKAVAAMQIDQLEDLMEPQEKP